MPLISTFGGLTAQTFGGKIAIGGSAFYDVQGDVLFTSPGVPFAYGTGDFTIEMWFYPTSFSGNRILWHQGAESTTTFNVTPLGQIQRTFTDRRYLTLYLNGAGQASMEIFGNSAYRTTSNTATLNAWNHVALVRSAGTVRIFLNGSPTGAAALGSNFSDTGVYTPCIGRFSYTAASGFTGYITNTRVAKSAYYSTTFNPARTPFTKNSQGASNVQLLLNHLNSTRFLTDSSDNNLIVTNLGTAFNNLSPYNSQYLPFGAVTPVSAVVTPSATTVNEGDTVTFTVAGTNTTNGTYYYTIEQPVADLTGADFSSGSLSGSFTITSNSGSFGITSVKDLTTEGDSTFAVYVRSGSITGPVIGTSAEINLVDSSLTPAFTVAPTSVDEGSSASFTVQNVGPNGTYYWTVLNGTSTNSDFSAISGSFTVSGNTGSLDDGTGTFSIPIVADRTFEGNETFQVQVRSTSTSGPVLITSSSVTINDVSVQPGFTSAPSSINEGSSGVFQVNNLGPAGTYYWTILNETTTNADFVAASGSFTTSTLNGTGVITVEIASDLTTEGGETFRVQVREGSTSGTVLVTSPFSVTINDTSLTPSPTFTVTPSVISEGSTDTFTVNNLGPAGTYFWTILNNTSSNADFSAVSGSFTTSTLNGNGSFSVTPIFDYLTEGNENFQVQVRSGSTAGPVLVTSSFVLIGDTSTTVTASASPTTIAEGTSTTISVSATSLPTGTYFWTVLNGTTSNLDFTATSGSFGVFLNTGSFTVTAATDGALEVAETFQVQIRTGSTSGTVIATTGTITISANST